MAALWTGAVAELGGKRGGAAATQRLQSESRVWPRRMSDNDSVCQLPHTGRMFNGGLDASSSFSGSSAAPHLRDILAQSNVGGGVGGGSAGVARSTTSLPLHPGSVAGSVAMSELSQISNLSQRATTLKHSTHTALTMICKEVLQAKGNAELANLPPKQLRQKIKNDADVKRRIRKLLCPVKMQEDPQEHLRSQGFWLSPFGSMTGGWKSMKKSKAQGEMTEQDAVCPIRCLCINVPVQYFSGQAREIADMECDADPAEQSRLKDIAALLGMMFVGTAKTLKTAAQEDKKQDKDDSGGGRNFNQQPYAMHRPLAEGEDDTAEVGPQFVIGYEELYDEHMENVVGVRFWKFFFDARLSASSMWDQVISENQRVDEHGRMSGSKIGCTNPKNMAEHKDIASLLYSEDRRALFTVQYTQIKGNFSLHNAVCNYAGKGCPSKADGLAPCARFSEMPREVRSSSGHESLRVLEEPEKRGEEQFYGGTNVLSPEYLFNAHRPDALRAGLVYKGQVVRVCESQLQTRTYFDDVDDLAPGNYMYTFALHKSTQGAHAAGGGWDGDWDDGAPAFAATDSRVFAARARLLEKGGFFMNVSPEHRTVFGIPFPRPLGGSVVLGPTLSHAAKVLLCRSEAALLSSTAEANLLAHSRVMQTLEGADVGAMVELQQKERSARASDTRSAAGGGGGGGGGGAGAASKDSHSVEGTSKDRVKKTRNRVKELAEGLSRLATQVVEKSSTVGEAMIEGIERRWECVAERHARACAGAGAHIDDLIVEARNALQDEDRAFDATVDAAGWCRDIILSEAFFPEARVAMSEAEEANPALFASWSFVSKVKDVVKNSLALHAAMDSDFLADEQMLYCGVFDDHAFADPSAKAHWQSVFESMLGNNLLDLLETICGCDTSKKQMLYLNDDDRVEMAKLVALEVVKRRLRAAHERLDLRHAAESRAVAVARRAIFTAQMHARAVRDQVEQHRALLLREVFDVHCQRVERSLRSTAERAVMPKGWVAPFLHLEKTAAGSASNPEGTASVAFLNPSAPNDLTESDRSPLSQYWDWMHREIFVGVAKIGGPDVQLMDALWLHCFEVFADSTFIFMLCGEKGTGKSSRTERLQEVMPPGMLTTAGTRSTMAGMNAGNDDCNGTTTIRQEMPQDLLNATPGSMPLEYWKTITSERIYNHSRSVADKDGDYKTVSLVTEHQEGHIVTSNWGQSFCSSRNPVAEEGALALRDRTVCSLVRHMASAGTHNNESDFRRALNSAPGTAKVDAFRTITSLVSMTLLLLHKVPVFAPDLSYADAVFTYLDEQLLVQEYNLPRKKPRRNKKRGTDLLTLTVLSSVLRVFFYASTAAQFEAGRLKKGSNGEWRAQRFSLSLLWDVVADLHPTLEVIFLAWSQGLDYDPNTSSHQLNSMTAICEYFGFVATDMLQTPFSNDAATASVPCGSVADLPIDAEGKAALPVDEMRAALSHAKARASLVQNGGPKTSTANSTMGIPRFCSSSRSDARFSLQQESDVRFRKDWLEASYASLAATRRVSNAFRKEAHKNSAPSDSNVDPALVIDEVLREKDVLGLGRMAEGGADGESEPMQVDDERLQRDPAHALLREAAVASMEQNAHPELFLSPHSSAMMANIAVVCSLYDFSDTLTWLSGGEVRMSGSTGHACRAFLGTKKGIRFQNLEQSPDKPARYDVTYLSKKINASIRETDSGTNFWEKAAESVQTINCPSNASQTKNDVFEALALSKDVLRDSLVAYTHADSACRIGKGIEIKCGEGDSLGICALQHGNTATLVQTDQNPHPLFFQQSMSYSYVSANGGQDARQSFHTPGAEKKTYDWEKEIGLLEKQGSAPGLMRNRAATPHVQEQLCLQMQMDVAVRKNRMQALSALHSRDIMLVPPMKTSFSQNHGTLHCALTHTVSHISVVAEALARLSLFPGCSSRQEKTMHSGSITGTRPPAPGTNSSLINAYDRSSPVLAGGQGYDAASTSAEPALAPKDGVKQLSYFYHVIQASITIDAVERMYDKKPLAHARRLRSLGFDLPLGDGTRVAPETVLRYTSITENDLERTTLSVPIAKMPKPHVGHVEVADEWTRMSTSEEDLQRELHKASHARGRPVSEVELSHMKRAELGAASMHGVAGDLFDVATWERHAVESKARRGFLPRQSGLELLRLRDTHHCLIARCLRESAQRGTDALRSRPKPFEAEAWEAAVRRLSALPLAPKAVPEEEEEETRSSRKRSAPDAETRKRVDQRERKRVSRLPDERADC